MFVTANMAISLAGLVSGFIHTSYVESLGHDRIQHLRTRDRERLERYAEAPLIGKVVGRLLSKPWVNAWRSHGVVHHSLSFHQYTEQFKSVRQQARADAYLEEHDLDKNDDYGRTVSSVGFLRFLRPFIPVNLAVWLIAPAGFAVPFGLTTFLSPLHSKYVHPYLHWDYEEAIVIAPLPVRLYLMTPIGRWMWVYHRMHHKNKRINFNLLPPIGDWLRGVYRRTTPEERRRAHQDGGPAV